MLLTRLFVSAYFSNRITHPMKLIRSHCQCGCGKRFRPKVRWQKYATLRCKNRAAAARLRERARMNGQVKHG